MLPVQGAEEAVNPLEVSLRRKASGLQGRSHDMLERTQA